MLEYGMLLYSQTQGDDDYKMIHHYSLDLVVVECNMVLIPIISSSYLLCVFRCLIIVSYIDVFTLPRDTLLKGLVMICS